MQVVEARTQELLHEARSEMEKVLAMGGAVAAVAICLVVGLGVGYVAGPEVLAQAGLNDAELAFAADDGDGNFLSEDVL